MEHADKDKILDRVKVLVVAMENGCPNSIAELRKTIVDADLLSLSKGLQAKELAVMYILKRFINDIYVNLFTDSSFSYSIDQLPKEIPKNLGHFAASVLSSRESCSAMESLCMTVRIFYDLLQKIEGDGVHSGGTERGEI